MDEKKINRVADKPETGDKLQQISKSRGKKSDAPGKNTGTPKPAGVSKPAMDQRPVKDRNGEHPKQPGYEYEMVLCVVNEGYADVVMEAVKREGARGGTVIRARGTAGKEAEERFHITIQPEKDLVLLVVSREIKDIILHTIYKSAGLSTPGQGIAFSIPVNSAVGLKKEEPILIEQMKAQMKEVTKEEKSKEN